MIEPPKLPTDFYKLKAIYLNCTCGYPIRIKDPAHIKCPICKTEIIVGKSFH